MILIPWRFLAHVTGIGTEIRIKGIVKGLEVGRFRLIHKESRFRFFGHFWHILEELEPELEVKESKRNHFPIHNSSFNEWTGRWNHYLRNQPISTADDLGFRLSGSAG